MKTLSIRSVVLAVVLLAIPLVSLAAEFRSGEQPSVTRDETINSDLYIAGGSVTSAGTVRGDVVSGGGTVLVSGPVSGDVLVGGGNITVLGDVSDDVRIGGGSVVVQGSIAGDAVLAGGQITLGGSRVGGDVAIAGGTIRIDSPIGGRLKIAGGDVYLNAPVQGDVEIRAEKVTLGPKANIAGALWYAAPNEATMEEGSVVRGSTNFEEHASRANVEKGFKAALAAFVTIWMIAKFLMLFVGALVLGLFFKRYARVLVANVAEQPLRELGRGIIGFIVTPVVSGILLFTVIGIPFGILGLIAFGALCIFSTLLAPIVIGSIIHKRIWKPADYVVNWKIILLGSAVYFVLGFIPFLGWLVKFGILLVTLGAVLGIKWSVAKEWR